MIQAGFCNMSRWGLDACYKRALSGAYKGVEWHLLDGLLIVAVFTPHKTPSDRERSEDPAPTPNNGSA